MYNVIKKKAEYAIRSLDRDLVFEAYGMAKAAWF